jgi:hypothetical protein
MVVHETKQTNKCNKEHEEECREVTHHGYCGVSGDPGVGTADWE